MKKEKPKKKIQSLGALDKMCRTPIAFTTTIDGETIEIELRRLTPREYQQVRVITDRLSPPMKETDNGFKVDMNSTRFPMYQEERDTAARHQRAMALALGVPMIRKEFNGALPEPDKIAETLDDKLTEDLQDAIFQTLMAGGSVTGEQVNFT